MPTLSLCQHGTGVPKPPDYRPWRSNIGSGRVALGCVSVAPVALSYCRTTEVIFLCLLLLLFCETRGHGSNEGDPGLVSGWWSVVFTTKQHTNSPLRAKQSAGTRKTQKRRQSLLIRNISFSHRPLRGKLRGALLSGATPRNV